MNRTTITLDDSEPIVETPTGIDVGRLTLLAEYIETHDEEFDMSEWEGSRFLNWITKRTIWGCKTTHCIAGWACELWSDTSSGNVPAKAQQVLGLTFKQAQKLFYIDKWPAQFRNAYSTPKYSDHNAWVAAERIRHFIATNGER